MTARNSKSRLFRCVLAAWFCSQRRQMGVYSSKQARGEPLQSPPAPVKRIEDPRSPTEEISRTPIEVADHRGLREANGGFSPVLRKASEPARKLRSNFESKLEEARQKENERQTSA